MESANEPTDTTNASMPRRRGAMHVYHEPMMPLRLWDDGTPVTVPKSFVNGGHMQRLPTAYVATIVCDPSNESQTATKLAFFAEIPVEWGIAMRNGDGAGVIGTRVFSSLGSDIEVMEDDHRLMGRPVVVPSEYTEIFVTALFKYMRYRNTEDGRVIGFLKWVPIGKGPDAVEPYVSSYTNESNAAKRTRLMPTNEREHGDDDALSRVDELHWRVPEEQRRPDEPTCAPGRHVSPAPTPQPAPAPEDGPVSTLGSVSPLTPPQPRATDSVSSERVESGATAPQGGLGRDATDIVVIAPAAGTCVLLPTDTGPVTPRCVSGPATQQGRCRSPSPTVTEASDTITACDGGTQDLDQCRVVPGKQGAGVGGGPTQTSPAAVNASPEAIAVPGPITPTTSSSRGRESVGTVTPAQSNMNSHSGGTALPPVGEHADVLLSTYGADDHRRVSVFENKRRARPQCVVHPPPMRAGDDPVTTFHEAALFSEDVIRVASTTTTASVNPADKYYSGIPVPCWDVVLPHDHVWGYEEEAIRDEPVTEYRQSVVRCIALGDDRFLLTAPGQRPRTLRLLIQGHVNALQGTTQYRAEHEVLVREYDALFAVTGSRCLSNYLERLRNITLTLKGTASNERPFTVQAHVYVLGAIVRSFCIGAKMDDWIDVLLRRHVMPAALKEIFEVPRGAVDLTSLIWFCLMSREGVVEFANAVGSVNTGILAICCNAVMLAPASGIGGSVATRAADVVPSFIFAAFMCGASVNALTQFIRNAWSVCYLWFSQHRVGRISDLVQASVRRASGTLILGPTTFTVTDIFHSLLSRSTVLEAMRKINIPGSDSSASVAAQWLKAHVNCISGLNEHVRSTHDGHESDRIRTETLMKTIGDTPATTVLHHPRWKEYCTCHSPRRNNTEHQETRRTYSRLVPCFRRVVSP